MYSSSQGAANKDLGQLLSYSVLDHAKPFFVGNGDAVTLTLNFGTIAPGTNSDPQTFSIGNWISNLGVTAGLDLDQILASGDIGAFTLTLSPFANLASGSALDFSAAFARSQAGRFDAIYDLLFSDENLPGAADLRTLRLELTGSAVPEPSSCALLIVMMFITGAKRRSGAKSYDDSQVSLILIPGCQRDNVYASGFPRLGWRATSLRMMFRSLASIFWMNSR